MAIDKTSTWSLGESVLWFSPNYALDVIWGLGESIILDEYVLLVTVDEVAYGIDVIQINRVLIVQDYGVGDDFVIVGVSCTVRLNSKVVKSTQETSSFISEKSLESNISRLVSLESEIIEED